MCILKGKKISRDRAALKTESNMARMLELSDKQFKIIIDMLKKFDNAQK